MSVQEIATQHVKSIINDQTKFIGRVFHYLHLNTGLDKDTLALAIVVIVSLLVIQTDFGNGILVGWPILVTYIFPNEKPKIDELLVYWSSYGVVTLFDQPFQQVLPIYMIFKLAFFALFFIRPFLLASKISEKMKKLTATAPTTPETMPDPPTHSTTDTQKATQ
uniref:Protein YOP1 n=1 Tax=Panagrolaimus sp. JU765 TaxID=591449 RepID=A0AC34QCG4_9BILA